ncbi:hypothetical protein BC939DRAFT_146363 [Gamsiella multidivaricata]|uniref:uncharacterized protein n=1 Tax=Gamsiella multidivaricata TaxID=101098 RepID=UPI00221F9C4A|nr:uncharacterized protein BC939DRAFT_146363 [Gamsiella multidivaricata]KAG0366150.1 hypothetical protein BGZ54_005745 [Gamsiella multidivaricata]KAI7831663.1 hypothetical protein BC939DRAFT_146363 [Gamsiella multidivaricata]
MDLPEIRDYLAQFLDDSQLASAAAVCKNWHASFTPFLYRHVEWSDDYKTPSKEAVESNSEHIRTLHLYDQPIDFSPEACTRLEHLNFLILIDDPTTWKDLATLVLRNPNLQSITLRALDTKPSYDFMLAVSTCLRLKILDVHFANLSRNCTDLLLDTCVRLEQLVINGGVMADLSSLDRWPEFPQIQVFDLDIDSGMSVQNQLQMFQKCPRLRSIKWYANQDQPCPTTSICELFSTFCPSLESLELGGWLLPDKDIVKILNSCPRMVSFSVFGPGFGQRALQSLVRHFSHLTSLNLRLCSGATSPMIQTIMTSCPELTYLCANSLNARDILGLDAEDGEAAIGAAECNPHSWICMNLRSLTLYIYGLEGKPALWQRLVLKQLARMTKLDFLTVGPFEFDPRDSHDGIDLRLETGLDILSSLKLLDRLCFDGLWQQMEEKDVRWMVETWPLLERVEGRVHHSNRRREELEKILKERSIALVSYMDSENENDENESDENENDENENDENENDENENDENENDENENDENENDESENDEIENSDASAAGE